MRFSWKWIAAVSALVLAIVASVAVAVAAPSGDNRDGGGDRRGDSVVLGPRQHLSDLARELGVSAERLRDAFEQVRADLGGRPRRHHFGERPRRADLERRCTQLTDALASELGKSGDEVRAAIESVLKADIEDAVDAGRLTRQQADRMIERIEDAGCLPPPFGPLGLHRLGCAERPPRPDGPSEGRAFPGRDELPAPPPGAPALMFAPAS
jgi:hypothetical protein